MPPIDDEVANLMPPERAEFVRKLRIDEGYTFRAIAAASAEEWGATWGSNQLIGEDLCRATAETLGIPFEKFQLLVSIVFRRPCHQLI